MANLTVFQTLTYNQCPVRIARVDEDGTVWFVAQDVCDVLGIQNVSDTLNKVLDPDEKGVDTIYTPGGPQKMAVISESGLYSLILRSRKTEAKPFRRWVTHTVLPSIRKTGGYGKPALPDRLEELLVSLTGLVTRLLDHQTTPALPASPFVSADQRSTLIKKAQTAGSAPAGWKAACERFGLRKGSRLFASVPSYQFDDVCRFLDSRVVPSTTSPPPSVPRPTPDPQTTTVFGQHKLKFRGRAFTVPQLVEKLKRTFNYPSDIDESLVETLIDARGLRNTPWHKLNGINDDVWDEDAFEWLQKDYQDKSAKALNRT